MKQFLLNLLLTAVAVFLVASLLGGVSIDGFLTSILVALVIGLLNVVVKPVLVILTIPVTILTLGLFLLVINTLIILMADWLVPGFSVDGFWWALLFSLLVSLVNTILGGLFRGTD